MKWKDSDDGGDTEAAEGGSFEEAYSPLRTPNVGTGARLASILNTPGFWLIIGAVVLIVCIVFFVRPKAVDTTLVAGMDQRLQELEGRIASLNGVDVAVEDLEKKQQNIESLVNRLDGLESSISKQMTALNNQIKQIKAVQSKSVHKPTAPSAGTKQTAKQTPKMHTVKKGQTLYSISKQYGLSVAQLTKWNRLSKGDPIHPGQKLKVSP